MPLGWPPALVFRVLAMAQGKPGGGYTSARIPGVGSCLSSDEVWKVTMRGRPLTKWLLPWFSTQVGHSEPHRSLVIGAP